VIVNGQEVPGDWETMSCYWGCGFIMAWEMGVQHDFGMEMDIHLQDCPMKAKQTKSRWPFNWGGSGD
jgi:hypothetical protein